MGLLVDELRRLARSVERHPVAGDDELVRAADLADAHRRDVGHVRDLDHRGELARVDLVGHEALEGGVELLLGEDVHHERVRAEVERRVHARHGARDAGPQAEASEVDGLAVPDVLDGDGEDGLQRDAAAGLGRGDAVPDVGDDVVRVGDAVRDDARQRGRFRGGARRVGDREVCNLAVHFGFSFPLGGLDDELADGRADERALLALAGAAADLQAVGSRRDVGRNGRVERDVRAVGDRELPLRAVGGDDEDALVLADLMAAVEPHALAEKGVALDDRVLLVGRRVLRAEELDRDGLHRVLGRDVRRGVLHRVVRDARDDEPVAGRVPRGVDRRKAALRIDLEATEAVDRHALAEGEVLLDRVRQHREVAAQEGGVVLRLFGDLADESAGFADSGRTEVRLPEALVGRNGVAHLRARKRVLVHFRGFLSFPQATTPRQTCRGHWIGA